MPAGENPSRSSAATKRRKLCWSDCTSARTSRSALAAGGVRPCSRPCKSTICPPISDQASGTCSERSNSTPHNSTSGPVNRSDSSRTSGRSAAMITPSEAARSESAGTRATRLRQRRLGSHGGPASRPPPLRRGRHGPALGLQTLRSRTATSPTGGFGPRHCPALHHGPCRTRLPAFRPGRGVRRSPQGRGRCSPPLPVPQHSLLPAPHPERRAELAVRLNERGTSEPRHGRQGVPGPELETVARGQGGSATASSPGTSLQRTSPPADGRPAPPERPMHCGPTAVSANGGPDPCDPGRCPRQPANGHRPAAPAAFRHAATDGRGNHPPRAGPQPLSRTAVP
ncbi:hypothetical protein SAVIM338S_03946 [Streptomyces avidinii]